MDDLEIERLELRDERRGEVLTMLMEAAPLVAWTPRMLEAIAEVIEGKVAAERAAGAAGHGGALVEELVAWQDLADWFVGMGPLHDELG
jgi:hypothetical protein